MKSSFLLQIFNGHQLGAGSMIDDVYKLARAGMFKMFVHNGMVYSTIHYVIGKSNEPVFDLIDLTKYKW